MTAKAVGQSADTVLVTTPLEMARVLFDASPGNAAAYARAAHGEAKERGDEKRASFWHEVCRELGTRREQLERAA